MNYPGNLCQFSSNHSTSSLSPLIYSDVNIELPTDGETNLGQLFGNDDRQSDVSSKIDYYVTIISVVQNTSY
jgi:hypothetical protein